MTLQVLSIVHAKLEAVGGHTEYDMTKSTYTGLI